MTSTETERFIDASIGLLALSRASRETAKQTLAYSKKVPTGIYSLQVVLSLLESTLEKTQHSAFEGKLDGNTCTRLLPEIQSCRSKIEELHANLVQLMRSIKFWSFRSFFRSKTAGTEKKQLKSLAEDIMRYHLQMAQAGAKCPSGPEILSITASTGIRLDYYLEYMISQLTEVQVVSPIPPSTSKECLPELPKNELAEMSVDIEEITKVDVEEPAKSGIRELCHEHVEQVTATDKQQALEGNVDGIPNERNGSVAKTEAKASMVRVETRDSVISNQANATSEDTTPANSYYNLFHSQVLDLMETEQGLVPRVFSGRLPDDYGFSKTEMFPQKKMLLLQHGIAAVQFEEACPVYPAHPAKLDDSSSKLSIPKSLSSITNRPIRPASPYRLPTPPPSPSGLTSALDDIRFAHFNSVDLPNVAQQVSQNAVDVLSDYHPSSSLLAMRKLRALTAAELELSRVTRPPGVHAKAARIYCDKALKAVGSIKYGINVSDSSNSAVTVENLQCRWRARVRLDTADIMAEQARAQTINGALPDEIKQTRREALEAYQDAVREVKDRCEDVEDDEVLARALLGSGRMVKQVGVAGDSASGTAVSSPVESAGLGGQDGFGRSRSLGFIEGRMDGSVTRRNSSIAGWRAGWMRGNHSREIAAIARAYFQEANAAIERGLARKVGEGLREGFGQVDEVDEDAAKEMLIEVKAEVRKAVFTTRL